MPVHRVTWRSLLSALVCPQCAPLGPQWTVDVASGLTPGVPSPIVSNVTYDRVRDNRLRRMADRQGLVLRRSRRRDVRALDYGRYWLSDARTNRLVTPEAGLTIDEVEVYLTDR